VSRGNNYCHIASLLPVAAFILLYTPAPKKMTGWSRTPGSCGKHLVGVIYTSA
jgi:hypothetical protein